MEITINMTGKINWDKYYGDIQKVCPWSSFAYRHGKLLHIPFQSFAKIIENEQLLIPINLWGVVYIDCPNTKKVEAWCEQRNSKTDTATYSFNHPKHKTPGKRTPIPVILQQSSEILKLARQKVFDHGMAKGTNPEYMVHKWKETGKPAGVGPKLHWDHRRRKKIMGIEVK